MVRPVMDPANKPRSFCFIFAGSSQLFVGPASSRVREQIKVRSSTRATSAGLERTRTLFGRLFSSSAVAVPESNINRNIAWYSSRDPSHQWIRSGLHIWAHSSTQCANFLCLFSLLEVSTAIVRLDIKASPHKGTDEQHAAMRQAARSGIDYR